MRFRKAIQSDSGISLAELLVGFFVSILMLTMVGGFFAAVARGTQETAVVDNNTRQMSTAMSTMTQYLHAATTYPVSTQPQPLPAFVSASATDVTFYAYVNLQSTAAQPVKVRYFIDPTTHNLTEQQWSSTCNATTGYCTFSSTVTKTFILGGPVASVTSDSVPLFQYYDSTYESTPPVGSPNVPMTLSTTTSPCSTSAPCLSSTQLANVDFVGINLEWGSTTAGTSGDGHIATVIGLLNLGQSGAQS